MIVLATSVVDRTNVTVVEYPFTFHFKQYMIQAPMLGPHSCPKLFPTLVGSSCDYWKQARDSAKYGLSAQMLWWYYRCAMLNPLPELYSNLR